jgi:hypothetical protein
MNSKTWIENLMTLPSTELAAGPVALSLVVSALAAGAAALLYRIFYEGRDAGTGVHRTFLLLCPSITALFLTIRASLPLSLGLVGSLAIIRFRTPVKDPEEVGFLLFAIASAVICATFNYPLLGMLFALCVLLLAARKGLHRYFAPTAPGTEGTVTLQWEGDATGEARRRVLDLIKTHGPGTRLINLSLSGGPTKISLGYPDLDLRKAEALEAALREFSPTLKITFLFDRAGTGL